MQIEIDQEDDIPTGRRFYWIRTSDVDANPIPEKLRIGGRLLWVKYANQPTICYKCKKVGHIAKLCDEIHISNVFNVLDWKTPSDVSNCRIHNDTNNDTTADYPLGTSVHYKENNKRERDSASSVNSTSFRPLKVVATEVEEDVIKWTVGFKHAVAKRQ